MVLEPNRKKNPLIVADRDYSILNLDKAVKSQTSLIYLKILEYLAYFNCHFKLFVV